MRTFTMFFCATVIGAAPCTTIADTLSPGTTVRVEVSGIEAGWHAGKIIRAGGCTLVAFDAPTKDGYKSVTLIAVRALQRKEASGWIDTPLAPLLKGEPARCLQEGAD